MTTIKYKLKDGEHVRTVALHFGFSSTEAIAAHPDNSAIVTQRGGIDHLLPGDVVVFPEGSRGRRSVGTGRLHEIAVSDAPGTFTLLLESAFRLHNEESPGDLSKAPVRWNGFGGTLKVAGVSVRLSQAAGGLIFENTTSRSGTATFPHLDDGTWHLRAEPVDDELSLGPAGADRNADHGLGFFERRNKPSKTPPPTKAFPRNTAYEVEYRIFELELTVAGQVVTSVSITAPAASEDRPTPIVPLWIGTGSTVASQIILVDWKPDFLRRVRPVLRPHQVERDKPGNPADSTPELVAVHQTASPDIGRALNSFLPTSVFSGAHFLNDEDGHIVRMADDRYYTQHAGGYRKQREPNWNIGAALDAGDRSLGRRINDRAVGIENVHTDKTDKANFAPDKHPFTPAQYASLKDLVRGLRSEYGIPAKDVVGHQDVTPKARCPGPHMVWEEIEGDDLALAPADLPDAEQETLFGGFFSGDGGAGRTLEEGDLEVSAPDGTFSVQRGKKTLAAGLAGGPISTLATALRSIGYGVDETIKTKPPTRHAGGHMDRVLLFCLAQFVRRFCSGSRQRADQFGAYNEVNLKRHSPKVHLDMELARLIRRVEIAATT